MNTMTDITRVYRSGIPSLRPINQKLGSIFRSLGFPPGSPFLEVFNDLILKLQSAGIIDHWIKNFYVSKLNIVDEIGPQVLTMDQLEIGFLVCIVPMSFALAAFLFEIRGRILAQLRQFLTFIKKKFIAIKKKLIKVRKRMQRKAGKVHKRKNQNERTHKHKHEL